MSLLQMVNIVHLPAGCITHWEAGMTGMMMVIKKLNMSPTGCLCQHRRRKEASNEQGKIQI